MNRREFLAGTGLAVASGISGKALGQETSALQSAVTIHTRGAHTPLPHFWEKAMGSDRTVVGLRDQWRRDLIRVRQDTGMQSVRSHGLFSDEMGIATSPGHFNFLYVDQIYDFMLEHGVRPFVELSFMPEAFSSNENTIFSYRGNVSPPRRWEDWQEVVHAFTVHCLKRYGLAEVREWKFEVWNEPNIDFWAGTKEEYFELFRRSAAAIKEVDARLQVGGPSTAQLDWIPDLIHFCLEKGVALDFVSSHVYASDPQTHIFGRDAKYPLEEVIPRGIALVTQQVKASRMPHLPLWITEWSSQNPAFIVHTLRQCIGLTEAMAYWTFSNVFEELGIPSGVFNEGFGLLDQWSIPRPSLHTFALLHKLGDKLLATGDAPVLATQRPDGSLAILVWNLVPAGTNAHPANGNPLASTAGDSRSEGSVKTIDLRIPGLQGRVQVDISQVNSTIGSAIPKWKAMGSPQYPSADQITQLRAAAELPQPQRKFLAADALALSIPVPADGVALIEISLTTQG